MNQKYINYLKNVEGYHLQIGEDIEGEKHADGTPILTYGYGHRDETGALGKKIAKMTSAEYNAWAEQTLIDDVNIAITQARTSTDNKYNKPKYGNITFDSLDDNRKAILIDYVYNTGKTPWMHEPNSYGSYSEFGDAVVKGTYDDMLNLDSSGVWKGTRYFNNQSLDRNQIMIDEYIKPNIDPKSNLQNLRVETMGLEDIKVENKIINHLMTVDNKSIV